MTRRLEVTVWVVKDGDVVLEGGTEGWLEVYVSTRWEQRVVCGCE